MSTKKIIVRTGAAPLVDDALQLPALSFAEPGLSVDTHLLLVGNGTNQPHQVQTSHTSVWVDYSSTPGVIQNRYKANPLSTVAAPAFQTNKKTTQPSGICEPSDGDVGIVVKGVLIGRFTPTGLVLAGSLTYTTGGGVILSSGTTAQRPNPAQHGFVWHNTTLDILEWWDSISETWRDLADGGGGGSGLMPWTVITANYNAQASERLIAKTDGGSFTVTLPAAPANGDEIWIIGDFATNPLTIARNGKLIVRVAEDLVLDKDNIGCKLVYDSTIGSWRNWP